MDVTSELSLTTYMDRFQKKKRILVKKIYIYIVQSELYKYVSPVVAVWSVSIFNFFLNIQVLIFSLAIPFHNVDKRSC